MATKTDLEQKLAYLDTPALEPLIRLVEQELYLVEQRLRDRLQLLLQEVPALAAQDGKQHERISTFFSKQNEITFDTARQFHKKMESLIQEQFDANPQLVHYFDADKFDDESILQTDIEQFLMLRYMPKYNRFVKDHYLKRMQELLAAHGEEYHLHYAHLSDSRGEVEVEIEPPHISYFFSPIMQSFREGIDEHVKTCLSNADQLKLSLYNNIRALASRKLPQDDVLVDRLNNKTGEALQKIDKGFDVLLEKIREDLKRFLVDNPHVLYYLERETVSLEQFISDIHLFYLNRQCSDFVRDARNIPTDINAILREYGYTLSLQ